MDRRWGIALVLVALVTAVLLALAPSGSRTSCSSVDGGRSVCRSDDGVSLLDQEGPGVLGVLAVPVVLALVALVAKRRAVTLAAAVLLTVLAALGAMSIGLFLLPTVVLAWLAYRASARSAAA